MVDHIYKFTKFGEKTDLKGLELNNRIFSLKTLEHLHSDAVDGLANALDKIFNISRNDTISCVSKFEESVSWTNLSAFKSEHNILVNLVLCVLLLFLFVRLYLDWRLFLKNRAIMIFHNRKRAE